MTASEEARAAPTVFEKTGDKWIPRDRRFTAFADDVDPTLVLTLEEHFNGDPWYGPILRWILYKTFEPATTRAGRRRVRVRAREYAIFNGELCFMSRRSNARATDVRICKMITEGEKIALS